MNDAHTSLIILIAIQLLPPSTSNSKSLGAKSRKSLGLLQPSSQTTLTTAAVTLDSSSSSIRRSFIFGQADRKESGYTNASLYRAATVFFRTFGFECDNLGRRSDRRERAKEDVMMWGKVTNGKDIVGAREEDMSCGLGELSVHTNRHASYLF